MSLYACQAVEASPRPCSLSMAHNVNDLSACREQELASFGPLVEQDPKSPRVREAWTEQTLANGKSLSSNTQTNQIPAASLASPSQKNDYCSHKPLFSNYEISHFSPTGKLEKKRQIQRPIHRGFLVAPKPIAPIHLFVSDTNPPLTSLSSSAQASMAHSTTTFVNPLCLPPPASIPQIHFQRPVDTMISSSQATTQTAPSFLDLQTVSQIVTDTLSQGAPIPNEDDSFAKALHSHALAIIRELACEMDPFTSYPYLQPEDLHSVKGCLKAIHLVRELQQSPWKKEFLRCCDDLHFPKNVQTILNCMVTDTEPLEQELFQSTRLFSLPNETMEILEKMPNGNKTKYICNWIEGSSSGKAFAETIAIIVLNRNSLQFTPIRLFSFFSHLKVICLAGNRLQNIPREFCYFCRDIRSLDISKNELSSLPKEMENLSQLETFNCSDNQLTSLPSLAKIKRLQVLNVANNRLSLVPSWIDNLHLNALDCSSNPISKVLFSNSKYLQKLNVSFARLTSVPDFSKLVSLENLCLSHNHITEIPDWMGRLWSLKNVDFSYNEIRSLEPLCGSHSLTQINLKANLIQELCVKINECSKLRLLDVSENPLEFYAAAIVDLPDGGEIRGVSFYLRLKRSFQRKLCCY